ncbi:MAG: hypothetical protein M1831_002926 [Alyxoria varia]|nr:MAG: hypothetical protein M1831_002926 [Alyxoria varia]
MSSFGTSPDGVRKMFGETDGDAASHGHGNRIHKALAHTAEDYYRQQFQSGNHLEDLWKTIQQRVESSLKRDGIPKECRIVDHGTTTKTLSLLRWCRATLLESITIAVFGSQLLGLDSYLLDAFTTFDDDSWIFHYQIPRTFCKDMHAAREQINETLTYYFTIPREERADACWLVQTLETEMRNVGVSTQDIAALLGTTFWVINGNAFKLCFWMLSHMLFDPFLYSTIREELSQALSEGNFSTSDFQSRLESCPHQLALYNELLRINTASATVRSVVAPTELGNVVLQPGTIILIPYRQLQFDKTVFGETAHTFDPSRFLSNPDLDRSSSFRPFGGGTTYCPGRNIARREILGFIAMVSQEYEMEAAAGEKFLESDIKKPCLGMLSPTPGSDLQVIIWKRNGGR